MYPSAETLTENHVYVEYIMWNAGNVPILVWKPAIVLVRRFGPADLAKAMTHLERVEGDKLIPEQAFSIDLGKGQVCIWRQSTGRLARCRPEMSQIRDVDREKAVESLRSRKGNRRSIFAATYFSKLLTFIIQMVVHEQCLEFSYPASRADEEANSK